MTSGFAIFDTIKEIEVDTDRDNFMSANEAKAYGLIDEVVNCKNKVSTKCHTF